MPATRPLVLLCTLAAIGTGLALADRSPSPTRSSTDLDDEALPALDRAALDRILRRLAAKGNDGLAVCPATAWHRRDKAASQPFMLPATCGDAPDRCLADCLDRRNGAACFGLARVVEATPDAPPLVSATLFQLACGAGTAAGCVNRAAGLRNTEDPGDPYPERPRAAREVCEFASFDVGCAAGDPWGCAMRGQAYALGEGVPADAAAARADYARACAIAPRFAACTFATRALARLDPQVKE